jgi:hypothetical protein
MRLDRILVFILLLASLVLLNLQAHAQETYSVRMRAYNPDTQDAADFTIVSAQVVKGEIMLPMGKISKNATLALVGWDQRDSLLKEILKHVVVVGKRHDNWTGPNLDHDEKRPALRITDARGIPLPRQGTTLSILFNPEYHLDNNSQIGHIAECVSVQINDLPCDEDGSPILPYVYWMSHQPPGWRVVRYPAKRIDQTRLFMGLAITISHPKYGSCFFSSQGEVLQTLTLQTPLVREGTPEALRAASGQILDLQNNEPVPNALISCSEVRTPGQGLINTQHQSYALTDALGQFRYYPQISPQYSDQRGTLIPAHSQYHLQINALGPQDLLPENTTISNDEPAIIKMRSGIAFHRFEFVVDDSNSIPDLSSVYVLYTLPNQDRPRHTVPTRTIEEGGVIPLGTYYATARDNRGRELGLAPLKVTNESPEVLLFEPSPGQVYEGQVLHGITGQPVSGALVFCYSGTRSHSGLSSLTDDQWAVLNQCDQDEASRHAAYQYLGQFYTIQSLVPTDDQGHYSLRLKTGETTHSLIVCHQNYVAFKVPIHILKSDEGQPIIVHDVSLYPNAIISVTPVLPDVPNTNTSIMPRWIIDSGHNPSWALDLIPWVNWKYQNEGQFAYDGWMEANAANTIYVPAGVTLKLRLETPYNHQLDNLIIPTDIRLQPGENLDLGVWNIPEASPFYVNVIDSHGQPVEGLPLHQVTRQNHYGVTYNTDESGNTTFYNTPGSQITIGIIPRELHLERADDMDARYQWHFNLPNDAHETPCFIITLPNELLQLFHQQGSAAP